MNLNKVFTSLIIVQLSIFFTACGGSNDVDSSFSGGGAESLTDGSDGSSAREIVNNFKLTCEDKENCSESVAAVLVISKDGNKAGICTGFLIGQDKLMTNSHCISELSTGESCAGIIKVLFASGEESQRSIGCTKIIKKSNVKEDLDYALLQLDRKLTHKVLPVSTEGLADTKLYNMVSVHTTSKYSARLVPLQKCYAAQNSMAYPNFKRDTSANVILADCHTQPGYSGAPIMNAKGEVVAINSNSLDIDDFKIKFNRSMKYLDASPLTRYIKADNLHCILLPGINSSISGVCKAEKKSMKRDNTDSSLMMRRHVLDQRIQEVNDEHQDLHHTTKFELASHSPEDITTLVPTCIKDPAIWEEEYRTLLVRLGLKSKKRDRMQIPIFDVEYGFNRYYQMDYEINLKDELEAKFKYPIRKIQATGNIVKYKMKVDRVKLKFTLLKLLVPIFWFLPIEEDTKKVWVTIFEKEIPRC